MLRAESLLCANTFLSLFSWFLGRCASRHSEVAADTQVAVASPVTHRWEAVASAVALPAAGSVGAMAVTAAMAFVAVITAGKGLDLCATVWGIRYSE
jgi:hypothetical protein